MFVEWDEEKERKNIRKHGITFDTAALIFSVNRFEMRSEKMQEIRYLTLAEVQAHVIAVVYTLRDNTIRIISARKASRKERKKYEYYCQKKTQ